MPSCSVCGKITQLHVMGVPLCVKCDSALVEECSVRNEPPKRSPETMSAIGQTTVDRSVQMKSASAN